MTRQLPVGLDQTAMRLKGARHGAIGRVRDQSIKSKMNQIVSGRVFSASKTSMAEMNHLDIGENRVGEIFHSQRHNSNSIDIN